MSIDHVQALSSANGKTYDVCVEQTVPYCSAGRYHCIKKSQVRIEFLVSTSLTEMNCLTCQYFGMLGFISELEKYFTSTSRHHDVMNVQILK